MFAFKRPRIGDDRHPWCSIEPHAIDFRSLIAEEMNVRRKVKTPVYAHTLEKNMSDGIEIMIAGNHHKLDVGVR